MSGAWSRQRVGACAASLALAGCALIGGIEHAELGDIDSASDAMAGDSSTTQGDGGALEATSGHGVGCVELGVEPGAPWPMPGRCPTSSGASQVRGAAVAVKRWEVSTGGPVRASPVVAGDGTIYVGSDDGKLYAIDPSGNVRWAHPTQGPISRGATIGADGTIYVPAGDKHLYALKPSGSLRWTFPDGPTIGHVESIVGVASDGTLYVAYADNKLYALSPDGKERWAFGTGGAVRSGPAVDADGTLYVGTSDNVFRAVGPNGIERWSHPMGEVPSGSPVVAKDGVYVGSSNYDLYKFDRTGNVAWRFGNSYPWRSPLSAGIDGTIFAVSNEDLLYAIEPDRSRKWTFDLGSPSSFLLGRGKPAIDVDGTAFIGSRTGTLFAVAANGAKRWEFQTGGAIFSSPAIGADGTIYVGSDDGKVYAVGP